MDQPVARWVEEEILEMKLLAGVAILRTRGCYWSIKEGCSMCGYSMILCLVELVQMLCAQWNKIRPTLEGKRYAKIYLRIFYRSYRSPLDFADEVMSDMKNIGIEKSMVSSSL